MFFLVTFFAKPRCYGHNNSSLKGFFVVAWNPMPSQARLLVLGPRNPSPKGLRFEDGGLAGSKRPYQLVSAVVPGRVDG